MKIVNIKLWKWFPSDDTLATKMARLCILREQLMFEFECGRDNKSTPLGDEYGSSYRQVYYFIRMCGTLREISSAINSIFGDNDYKKIERRNRDLKIEMDELKTGMESSISLIKDIRDNIGAHIQEKAVQQALQSMDIDRAGFLQMPKRLIPSKMHYKFTGELLMAILFRDTPGKKQLNKAKEIVNALVNPLSKLFHRIDLLFVCYARERKLL